MPDWFNLFCHFLWLFGLALLLTTLSLVHWQAEQAGKAMPQALTEPVVRLVIALSFFLLALGLALLIEPWGYKAGWLSLLLLATWIGGVAWRNRPRQVQASHMEQSHLSINE